MDALQDQAMALETDRRRGLEIERIEAALKRIEDGDYGYCLSCGENIPAKRLEFNPATPVCVDCASD
jgi:DnaK suppressor protein